MIGRPLSARYGLGPLAAEKAIAILRGRLAPDAAALVAVRAKDARMIACLIVQANEAAVRLCGQIGLEMTLGGTGVVGLLGSDAARLFPQLPEHQRAWLEIPCGERETKVMLVAGGIALLSVEANGGKVAVTAVP
jgi:hypothetical protein